MAWSRDRIALSTALVPGAQILGLGEKACGQDRRGRTFTLWNTDPQNYQPGADPLYLSIPMFIALVDGRAHSVFYDNSYRASLDVGATQNDELLYAADGGELCYYYFHGPALPQVLERYTELTGRPALPPLWSLGFQQSRWSYFPADRVREVARLLREHRIPCDALYLDIHYMDGYRVFTWDRHRFPDPTGLLADLHRQGFRVVLAVDPHVKSDRSYRICADGLMKRVFCTYPDGRPAGGPVWPGEAFFPDFTAERVRWWWGDLFSDLLDDGVDGFWNDMNEPTIIGPSGDTLADCVRHDWEGQGADHRQAHNVYGQLTARATAEGLRRLRPNSRTFVLTRSGWAGVQRDAFSWTGDNKSTWEHLRLSLPMVLGKGLSGLAFTGADVGGFDGDAEGELLVRWTQMGAFLPLFRNHASIWSRDQEPWAFGESYLGPIRDAIELRYRLLPYLYTAAWQCSQTGAPPARPLAWAFPSDPHACQLDSQFLCGDSLLVAPVVERGATCRQVYLPRETWFDYWTGQRHPGPITLHAESPLERIPLWVRGGTVLPTWPLLQHTGEAEPDRLFLDVYSGNGKSVLYEDDGLSQAYTRGDLRVTEFRQRLTDADLEITASRHGGYCPSYGLCEWRVFGLSQPSQVEVDERPLTNWRWFPDQPGGVLSFETGPLVQRVVIRFASAPAAP
jgi:alpha-glucosidase